MANASLTAAVDEIGSVLAAVESDARHSDAASVQE
jgi:hypothetical protein